jgi:hypothetical protein
MATGAPGTNGVWQYGEDDSEATFSALLNKAASTTDTQIGADRTRLTSLEGTRPGTAGVALKTAAGASTVNGVTAITLPSGRFSVAPIVTCSPEFGGAASSSFYSLVLSRSATSISLYAVTNAGALVTSNFTMDWIAIQMTTGSAAG